MGKKPPRGETKGKGGTAWPLPCEGKIRRNGAGGGGRNHRLWPGRCDAYRTLIEADPEESSDFDPEGVEIDLDMPSAVSAENWVGRR